MRCQRGQATIEWTGIVLLMAVALGALATAGPRVDGRAFGAWLAHSLVCAVRGEACASADDPLRAVYGEQDAALVRRYAPNLVYEPGTYTLPVDWRRCRSHRCSDARDDRDADVHRGARGGTPATAFTHIVREGGEVFLQYWLYYPDSTSTVAKSRTLWAITPAARVATLPFSGTRYPGFHHDDWESVQVRIDRSGRAWTRASSHHGYQGCKQRECKNRWIPHTGWSRVSRGSHAGHIPTRRRRVESDWSIGWPPVRNRWHHTPAYPGVHLRERTTTAPGLTLIPLESIDRGGYEPLDEGITPPWEKEVYEDPRSDSTS